MTAVENTNKRCEYDVLCDDTLQITDAANKWFCHILITFVLTFLKVFLVRKQKSNQQSG